MTTTTHRLLPYLLLSLPLFAGAAIAQAKNRDTIIRKSDKDLTRIEIVKLDFDKITYSKDGNDTEIATSAVADYRFGTAPSTFLRGSVAADRGNHAAAAPLFVQAADAADSTAVKLAATFFAGRSFALAALQDATHANNAIAQLQSYLKDAPNGYYLPEAKVRLAQASLRSGDAATAETMLKALDAEAIAGNWPLIWPAEIKFSLGKAQFAQNKFNEARFSFQAVDGAIAAALGQNSLHNSVLNNMRTDALVLQGETFIGEKNYNDALRYYQTLAGNKTRGVKAAAKAGEGQILFIQGRDKKDVEKLRQAQIALAEASIEPDTNASTSAKALYLIGMVLVALGDQEENAPARAKTYFQSVRNNYPSTEWAAKARQELGV